MRRRSDLGTCRSTHNQTHRSRGATSDCVESNLWDSHGVRGPSEGGAGSLDRLRCSGRDMGVRRALGRHDINDSRVLGHVWSANSSKVRKPGIDLLLRFTPGMNAGLDLVCELRGRAEASGITVRVALGD